VALNAQHKDEAEMLDDAGESREELMAKKAELDEAVKGMEKALAAYSDNDPTELERKKEEVKRCKEEAEKWTEEIYSMESYLKKMAGGDEGLKVKLREIYEDFGELDDEEGVLREIC
jgi:chromosome segregation ATPase